VRLLDRGEGSEVYLAIREQDQQQVALKILPGRRMGEELTKFYVHAKKLARLRHPHIVHILDFGVEDDFAFLIMDYAPNGTLREKHPRGSVLAPETVNQYVQQIAAAIGYLHEQTLIHRDLKPHNLLVGPRGEVLLGDFGIAVVSHSLDPLYPEQYDFEGTVLYAAPEQLIGRPRRSSDQYSLGVIAYEWLCGECPFTGDFEALVEQHLHKPAPPLRSKNPALSPLIEQVVMKALTKDVEKRFPSIAEFAQALDWATAQVLTQKVRALPRPKRQFKSPRLFP